LKIILKLLNPFATMDIIPLEFLLILLLLYNK
jgi:hypothetical protein